MSDIADKLWAVEEFLRTLPCVCGQKMAGDVEVRPSIVPPKCAPCQAIAALHAAAAMLQGMKT